MVHQEFEKYVLTSTLEKIFALSLVFWLLNFFGGGSWIVSSFWPSSEVWKLHEGVLGGLFVWREILGAELGPVIVVARLLDFDDWPCGAGDNASG